MDKNYKALELDKILELVVAETACDASCGSPFYLQLTDTFQFGNLIYLF